jgi:hypothetical protein
MKTIIFASIAFAVLFLSACNEPAQKCDGHLPSSSDDSCANPMCRVSDPGFPTFDKTCTVAGDCVFGVHQTDCCGSTKAIGMNKAELAQFTADEKVCTEQYAKCACPAYFTVSEDGQRAMAGQSMVVECQLGQCMTTVK